MFHIVLFEPEIPPNTGNIMRLCANMGAQLHLIEPLGFRLDEKSVRRAGMDYRDMAVVTKHLNLDAFFETVNPQRIFACSTRGKQVYSGVRFQAGDALLFGCETRGLPASLLNNWPEETLITIPMVPESRSLNLANSVSIIAYEAWRQLGYIGAR